MTLLTNMIEFNLFVNYYIYVPSVNTYFLNVSGTCFSVHEVWQVVGFIIQFGKLFIYSLMLSTERHTLIICSRVMIILKNL